MKKKSKKIWNSVLAILGILSLGLLGFSTYAIIYTYIYEHPFRYFIIGLISLGVLMILGGITFKKIKSKVIDIFT